MDETFGYLSLIDGDLGELRVRFYDAGQGELYVGEFDTAGLKIKKRAE